MNLIITDASTTREAIEAALDGGRLYAEMNHGKLWRARRNGRTKTWKTRPADYRIPIKVGLKVCGYVEPFGVRVGNFAIKEE